MTGDPRAIPDRVWRETAALPEHPLPAQLEAMRRRHPDIDATTWSSAITMTRLRVRARTKLGPVSEDLWLTDTGLQQASRPVVATRRARLLAAQGITEFVDLGCGLGMDSAAAARAGLVVTAVERDPTTAVAARHNLSVLAPGAPARVTQADATAVRVPDSAVAFLDPARRSGTRADGTAHRSLEPTDWQPPWPWLEAFARGHPRTVAKVAPGIDRDLPNPEVAVEWVSVAGDLVEATLWFPGVRAGRPRRTATIMTGNPDPWDPGTEVHMTGDGEPSTVGPLGDWLIEPDPAVIRAGLVGDLALRFAGRALSAGIAYLTADHPPDPAWGRVSRIEAQLPFRVKPLRAEMRRREIGSVEIRTRGLALDPSALRRQLALHPGGPAASLVITRLRGRAVALLVSDAVVPGR